MFITFIRKTFKSLKFKNKNPVCSVCLRIKELNFGLYRIKLQFHSGMKSNTVQMYLNLNDLGKVALNQLAIRCSGFKLIA